MKTFRVTLHRIQMVEVIADDPTGAGKLAIELTERQRCEAILCEVEEKSTEVGVLVPGDDSWAEPERAAGERGS